MKQMLSWCCGAAMALLLGLGACASESGVVLTADTPWLVATNLPESVQRALSDVERDWYKVFGHRPVILAEAPPSWRGPLVRFGLTGAAGAPESFSLRMEGQVLAATGADVRGAIYAAYALSEDILGVDPWWFWADQEPARRAQIEVPAGLKKDFGPATFRYRGWFINDEDLLGGYAPDPLRENVFSLELLDRICETLLRLRGNMLVPGTFNYPDERCWELASRRGLALNMHHILVVGLNTYRWPQDVPFSYSKHPDIMERYWQRCIEAYKGREVVWTVGYRGKHDRPFWADEPELKTPEARGAVITAAIAKQVELIRAVDPNGMIIANLWAEGAEMMQAGHLKLPAGVVQVWPDDGTGMIRDNGTVQAGQGIYFHTAMLSGSHNQLSEMVPPSRIYGEIGRFVRAGATNFFLVNTSDIRPVPLSTECAMRFVWNAAPQLGKSDAESMDEFLTEWCGREFGKGSTYLFVPLYKSYFNIPYQRQETRYGDNRLITMQRTLDRVAAPLIAHDKPLTKDILKKANDLLQFASSNYLYVVDLALTAKDVIPSDFFNRFFYDHLLTQLDIHRYSLKMLEDYGTALTAYGKNDKPQAIAEIEKALVSLERVFAALHAAEAGKWSGWYFGERFVGLEATRDRLRTVHAFLRGEPPPPLHAPNGYPELYRYQEPFQSNFPRMYPHAAQP
jgi:hypothetical protein